MENIDKGSFTFKKAKRERYEIQELDLNKLLGEYQQKYGMVFHSQYVILLETIHHHYHLQLQRQEDLHENQLNNLNNQAKFLNDNFQFLLNQNNENAQNSLVAIKIATSEINKNKRSIQTENPKVAIGENVSKYGMWTLMMVTLGFMIFFGLKQVQKIETFYTYQDRSPEFIKYRNFAQHGKIISNPTKELKGLYVELRKPKKGEKLQYGLNYYFDAPDERILVPLGLDENGKNLNE